MSVNEALAARLDEMARMMELLGEDSFRASAHARAARAIGDMPEDVAAVAKDRARLLAVQGIGAKLADKIIEFCTSGTIAEHAELRSRVPAGLLDVMQVPGLGPKTVRALWQTLNVTDIASLEAAIASGTILTVPRMGEKAVEKIKASIAVVKAGQSRLWLGRAAAVASYFCDRLRTDPDVARVEPAGSLRRGKETIGDIDILVALRDGAENQAERIISLFADSPGIVQVLVAGGSKASVRVTLDHDLGRWKKQDENDGAGTGPTIQVDLRVLPLSRWGSALMYFTGSKEHNVRLRERALSQGRTLSEWGLFPEDGHETPPQQRGIAPIASATEEEVYSALGLPWVPPEAREDRGELDAGALNLVSLQHIRAELHSHTTASDGIMSIEEIAKRYADRGFHTLAITDHSQSSTIAKGLKPDRLRRHIDAVRSAGAKLSGIRLLAGSEVDILAEGELDYDDELLAALDVVVASPHAALSQDPETATNRLLRAIQHPLVHIIGHPTGRLINRRKGLEPDMTRLIAAAVEHDVALEINSHWMRLDLRDMHVRLAVQAGAKIAINCDTHAPEDMDNLAFGVMTARRGWCPPELCINAWNADKLHAWLAR